MALFTIMFVSAIIFTLTGFFFRGPGFKLYLAVGDAQRLQPVEWFIDNYRSCMMNKPDNKRQFSRRQFVGALWGISLVGIGRASRCGIWSNI